MRLISQDGKIDIPYEQVAVEIDDYYNIEIDCRMYNAHYTMTADYTSEIKARKAMEMLRIAYLRGDKVFHFPKDKEVEV